MLISTWPITFLDKSHLESSENSHQSTFQTHYPRIYITPAIPRGRTTARLPSGNIANWPDATPQQSSRDTTARNDSATRIERESELLRLLRGSNCQRYPLRDLVSRLVEANE